MYYMHTSIYIVCISYVYYMYTYIRIIHKHKHAYVFISPTFPNLQLLFILIMNRLFCAIISELLC